jgi:hypothetical protein
MANRSVGIPENPCTIDNSHADDRQGRHCKCEECGVVAEYGAGIMKAFYETTPSGKPKQLNCGWCMFNRDTQPSIDTSLIQASVG